jgi:hypothetical protein
VDERAKQAQPGAYQYRRGHDPQCTAELEHASDGNTVGPELGVTQRRYGDADIQRLHIVPICFLYEGRDAGSKRSRGLPATTAVW